MPFPVQAPAVSHSGTYIPDIFSGKLLVKFHEACVLTHIANTDYEGEIANQGDRVEIRTTPNMVTRKYVKGVPLTYDDPNSGVVTLNIDQGEYYGFKVNSVDKAQSDIPFLEKWSDEASETMKVVIDSQVLAAIPADAHAQNMGANAGRQSGNINLGTAGAPVEVTKENVLDYIVVCGQVLSEQKIPVPGRWMTIPPWMKTRALLSDLKNASLTGDGKSTLRSGRLGVIGDFELFESLNIKHVVDGSNNCASIPFGHKCSLTFASQIVEHETLKNPTDFGDLVRGLQVFGFKVIKSDAMGVFYATPK